MVPRRAPLNVANIVALLVFLGVLAALAQPGGSASATAPRASLNCTFSQGYWKTHPKVWPVRSLTLGGTTYSQSQLLAILNAPTKKDVTYILATQLIAAKLNIANGADGSAVAQTIVSADAFLTAHPLGITLSRS